MKRKAMYGDRVAEVTSAAGVRGILCRNAVDGSCFFRVPAPDHTFIDYDLRHDDLAVTIAEDELASFYRIGEDRILDHSPGVLGLADVASDAPESAVAQQGAPPDH